MIFPAIDPVFQDLVTDRGPDGGWMPDFCQENHMRKCLAIADHSLLEYKKKTIDPMLAQHKLPPAKLLEVVKDGEVVKSYMTLVISYKQWEAYIKPTRDRLGISFNPAARKYKKMGMDSHLYSDIKRKAKL